MSYILDALRRAEVERERGKVPGVHDQPLAGAPTAASDAQPDPRGAWLAGGVVVVLAVVAAVWAWKDHGDAPPVVASASNRNAPAMPSSTAPVPIGPVPVAPLAAAPTIPALPAPPPTANAMTPSTAAAPQELAPVPALPHSEPQVRDSAPNSQAPALAGANASADSRIYEASELPADIRRALPPLVFGGAMYADAPSARLLIVNGQVAHEGDPVAKGVVLEQIRLKTAVLVFRGYRYIVTY